MPANTIDLTNSSDATVTFTLEKLTPTGAIYKVASRALSLPHRLEFSYLVAAPNSKANSRMIVKISDTVQNSSTGALSTGTLKMELSVPADSVTWTQTKGRDIMRMIESAITNPRRDQILGAIVPAQVS